MFEATDIVVRRSRRTVLGPLSCTIAPGKLTVVAGPNGAGKSTLLHALAGSVPLAQGAVTLSGHDVRVVPAWRLAAQRAVLMQASQIAFPFTVREIVTLGMTAAGRAAAHNPALTMQALACVDLTGFEDRYYQELSGGEQQRVQLARTLCQVWQPVRDGMAAFLMLDEPTASLDIKHQIQTLKIAQAYARRGGGVIAVLHDIAQAARYADKILLLSDGNLVAHDEPAQVFTRDRLRSVFGLDGEELEWIDRPPATRSIAPPANAPGQTPPELPRLPESPRRH